MTNSDAGIHRTVESDINSRLWYNFSRADLGNFDRDDVSMRPGIDTVYEATYKPFSILDSFRFKTYRDYGHLIDVDLIIYGYVIEYPVGSSSYINKTTGAIYLKISADTILPVHR